MGIDIERGGSETAMRILRPGIPAEYVQIARDAVGTEFETEFRADFSDVTDEQWANADAIVGPSPPSQYVDRPRKWRIFVRLGGGYDDVDLERFGATIAPSPRERRRVSARRAA
jgi:hypothetical protein